MAVAKFFLKEPKSKDETLVYLFFSYNNKRLKYSTGEKINPSFWNPEKKKARETKQFSEYPEFNARLGKTNLLDHLSPKQTDHWKPGLFDPLIFDNNSKELFLSQRA